ncbi:MAG: ATP-binding protein [Candidatus Aminicenantes bacterium]|nr:MAG: ATP-binding protein [Candidatus Aminicenantes bacterium]
MLKNRYLTEYVLEDLAEKMVFIGGPRQVGKTTLAANIISQYFKNSAYFTWDNKQDRRKIMNSDWPGNADLLILDELHKYRKWKNLVKGEYDKLKEKYKFLITGSARLDVYRKGGDSLQGRYHYYRMHPFSMAELLNKKNRFEIWNEPSIEDEEYNKELETLFEFGGFPEPLAKQNKRFLRRWHNEKVERLFREDIRDMEQIRDLDNMKLLSDMLPEKIGSLLSINAIREDLEVSHRAVTNWLNILEKLYYHFRLYPYTGKLIRSLKKEPKLFLWDWSEVNDPGARFENMIASHLLKWVHFLYDYEGYRTELYFLRNVDKKEVDFFVTVEKKPWLAVEVKLSDTNASPSLYYFKERLNIPYLFQVVKTPGVDRLINGVRVISASRFLPALV